MKTERIFLGILVLACILKLLHVPGIGALLTVAAIALGIMYLFFGFYFFSYKTIKQQNLVFSIISGVGLAIVPSCIIFKILFWPAAQIMLRNALCTLVLFLIITIILRLFSKEALFPYYKNHLIRLLTLLAICLALYITPLSTLVKIQHRENPELARLKIRLYSDPFNEQYKADLHNYLVQHDSLHYQYR